jgi:spore coat protein CotH
MKSRIFLCLFIVSLLSAGSIYSQSEPESAPVKKSTSKSSKNKDNGKSFFEKDSIHVIKINFVQCGYWDSLVYYRKISDSLDISTFMQASVSVDNKRFYSVGIRFKGESSYEFYPGKKKPIRIKFNKFVKGQTLDGLEEINLNNNFKDPTMLREKIYLDMLNKEGLPAPRATYAKVYINDKYWGLYLVTDNIDKVFLETRFNDSRGNLYQGEPLATFVYYGNEPSKYYNKYGLKNNQDNNNWSDLIKFIRLINDTTLSDEDFLRRLESSFNLDKCLRAWAINNLIGNIDAYNMFYPHNFFIFHDSVTMKWHWISLDGNYAFAAWNPVMSLPSLLKMSVLVPDSTPYKEARPLLDKTIRTNKGIQKRYLAIVNELMRNEFKEENLNRAIDSLSMRIRIAVYADVNKMYSNKDFDTNINTTIGDPLDPGNFIPGLKSFISDRRKNVEYELQQLQKQFD